jgi:aspartate beta-hydroxylase
MAAIDGQAVAQAALAALRAGDAAKAQELFGQLMTNGRGAAFAWLGLGYARRDLGDAGGAMAAADEALRLEPRNLRALILKADLLAGSGDMPSSSSFYAAALRAAPTAGQIPADLQAELARARAAVERHAADYERHLRDALAAKGVETGDSRFGHSLDILFGKRQVYVQQPRNYYFPNLPQAQFYDRADFPWLDGIEAAAADIRAELIEVLKEEGAFTPYVEAGINRPSNDYQGMLGNPAWSAFYLWKNGEPVPENAARCPRTMAALDAAPLSRIPNRTPSILFSLLKPGARIPPHNGLINTRLICHLPLIVPQGCGFRVGNDTRQWREGEAWLFDDTIEHEAWNDSAETRVILLFDVWRPELSDEERTAVAAMFEAIDAFTGKKPEWEI